MVGERIETSLIRERTLLEVGPYRVVKRKKVEIKSKPKPFSLPVIPSRFQSEYNSVADYAASGIFAIDRDRIGPISSTGDPNEISEKTTQEALRIILSEVLDINKENLSLRIVKDFAPQMSTEEHLNLAAKIEKQLERLQRGSAKDLLNFRA